MVLKKKTTRVQKKIKKNTVPESVLQRKCDFLLKTYNLFFIRIPDTLWRFIIFKSPIWVRKIASDNLAGISDNILFIPINNKYSLSVFIENKTATGRLNGKKQRELAKLLNYQICRSEEDVLKVIIDFKEFAERIKKLIDE